MRVHLRGVVIGVTTILSIAVIVSIFNALESASDNGAAVSRQLLSADQQNGPNKPGGPRRRAAGARAGRAGGAAARSSQSPEDTDSDTSPGPRAGGPGARAGGPGARAGGRFGGAAAGTSGARARGPGARAGGPGARAGGPGARAGGPGARAGGPGARAGGAGARAGGPGARAGGPGSRMGGGPRARVTQEEDEEEEEGEELEMEEPAVRPRARGGAAAGRAAGRFAASGSREKLPNSDNEDEEEEEEEEEPVKPRQKKKSKKKAKEEEEEDEKEDEKPTEPPKKKEPPYPEWWKESYPRSAVTSLQDQFVGDKPLYPECPGFQVGSVLRERRYGYVEPPYFMRNSKNPCWFEWNGKKDILKCLPYFYVAGVAKAATADIYNRVGHHPSVLQGGAVAYYWWDRLRYGASKNMKYTREAKRTAEVVNMKEYAKVLIGKNGKNLTKELLYRGKSDSIIGDASPTYLTENTQWDVFEGNQGCSEPRVIPATFIRHIFPDARIIIVLRDPIERLYSRFLANVPYVQEFENATASLFHTFTVQAVQTYRECFAKMSVRHCAYNASLFSNAVIRLSEGMYPIFLEDWFRVFPREQILVLKYEEYISDTKNHLVKIFQHLGLDPLDEYSLLKLTDIPVTRKGRTRAEEGEMMPETAALLSDFYQPFLLKLADLLDDEKWQFKRDDPLPRPVNLEAHEEGNAAEAMPVVEEPKVESPPEELKVESSDVENNDV